MYQHNKTTRFFAAALMIGGIAGFVIVALLAMKVPFMHFWLILFLFFAAFMWAIYTGFRLWQGTPYGRKWAVILFASQIPVILIPGLHYQWSTGAKLVPLLYWLDSGPVLFRFTPNIGADISFVLGSLGNLCIALRFDI